MAMTRGCGALVRPTVARMAAVSRASSLPLTSARFKSSGLRNTGAHQSTSSTTASPSSMLAATAAKALRAVGLGPTARRRAQQKIMRSRPKQTRAKAEAESSETAGSTAGGVKKLDAAAVEAIVASDRTHALNSRLGLSRNSLVLRFSNENSYLNWARNGVLSSGVGVAMYAQEHHRGAQLSGAGLLLLGFGYIGVGTAKYIYYILRFRHVMELSWGSVIGTISHASIALIIWLTATASFLESVPLELDAMLLTEPIASYLPFRIRQGLIETYSLYLDDLEHHMDEQERVLAAIQREKDALAAKEAMILEAVAQDE
uniref:DUF202 domain-containing protein n=1 Tax=Globisporangium ultimum (strain ATCC 200006 / CBS 805.95 / DAOM BR144) TaxID=431595 RepID=K3WBR3_GLOUD